jgi:hypothetical protein
MPLDRFLVLTALVGVAGVERVAHPLQNLIVEAKPPEQQDAGFPWHLSA